MSNFRSLACSVWAVGRGGLKKRYDIYNYVAICNDGIGNESEDQGMAIVEQVRDQIMAGLQYENGKVGGFSFFRCCRHL